MNGGGASHSANLMIPKEGIYLILSRWTAFVFAVENEPAGRRSRQLADQLASDIYSWFTLQRKANEPIYIDDLENILDETMLDSLHINVDDGGVEIEQVAEKLMIVHEECMQGNYSSVENLRRAAVAGPPATATRHRQDDDDDDSSGSDEGDDDMI